MSWTLINAASVYVEKAPPLWIEVATACLAAREDARAVWVGGVHPDYDALAERAARDSGGRIAFPGAALNAEVLARLGERGAILLIASDIEVFPVSIMEATQLGCPVICRRFPGHEEVLGEAYALAFSSVDEAVQRFAAVTQDYEAARHGARLLFEQRFRKDDAWYAAAGALIGAGR